MQTQRIYKLNRDPTSLLNMQALFTEEGDQSLRVTSLISGMVKRLKCSLDKCRKIPPKSSVCWLLYFYTVLYFSHWCELLIDHGINTIHPNTVASATCAWISANPIQVNGTVIDISAANLHVTIPLRPLFWPLSYPVLWFSRICKGQRSAGTWAETTSLKKRLLPPYI